MKTERIVPLVMVSCFMFLPAAARAQSATSGAIAGVVRDSTGAVLPGVTVEAASPALIEKVRTVVTDGQGQYKIVELRPGTYSVTFTLPGFSTFKREGIELTTGFTATANADMKVGALEETVTVTGASPVVDIQNVRRQTVLSRELLDTVPTAKTMQAFTSLTLGARGTAPAASQDVGGNKGEALAGFGVHGTRANDSRMFVDGMLMSGGVDPAAHTKHYMVNQVAIQEVTLTTRGNSAEMESGGPQINNVPKDGGNRFTLYASGTGAGGALQSDKLTDDLRARGLTEAPSIKRVYDVGAGFGGPIKKDKLWFYSANRWWGSSEFAPGNYFDAVRGDLFHTPDLSRPAFTEVGPEIDYSLRLTWQASSKHKIAAYVSKNRACNCYFQAEQNRAPEAAVHLQYRVTPVQATWSYPASNRLLFEAGFTGLRNNQFPPRIAGVSSTDIAIVELSTGYRYNARTESIGPGGTQYGKGTFSHQINERFSVSYVTGSHAFKAGMTSYHGWAGMDAQLNDPPVQYQFRLGVPVSLSEWASPQAGRFRIRDILGLYAQDQWTIQKLTLNLGVRFDHLNAFNPAIQIPAGPFVPARDFPAVYDVPNWTDLSPRLGAAYDLFGNGKTAVKISVGRFVDLQTLATARLNHPAFAITTNATRTWADANGNYVPDCVLTNPLANGECGQLSNLNLGRTIRVTNWAKEVTEGFGQRGYSWQGAASLQHELAPNVGVTADYYRTWYGNFTVVDNLAVTPADFDPFCITAPVDVRLPGGGGNQLCGLYDVKPGRFGQVDSLVSLVSNFGKQTEVYNGFEIGLNARFGQGGLLQGGVATGQTVFDNCVVVDSPQAVRPGFCKTKLPYEGQTQVKLAAIYPLPWYDIQLSGVFQNLAGIPITALWVVPNALVAPSLGRNLAAGANGTVAVDLIEPNTIFEDRLTQLDLRLTKIFRFGRARLKGDFDIYNVFNGRDVLSEVLTYGASWQRPLAVLGGRLFKFGAQFDF